MDKMNRAELEGVIAHEVAHIRNGDILVMTVAVATVGAIAMISDIFFRMLYWGGFTGGGASPKQQQQQHNSNGAVLLVVLAAIVFVALLAPLAATLLKAGVAQPGIAR